MRLVLVGSLAFQKYPRSRASAFCRSAGAARRLMSGLSYLALAMTGIRHYDLSAGRPHPTHTGRSIARVALSKAVIGGPGIAGKSVSIRQTVAAGAGIPGRS